jgi:peroxiredoxin
MQARSTPRRLALFTLAAVAWSLSGLAMAAAAATVGQPAPDFQVKDSLGRTINLSDFRGKHVVLEWTNPACPFVVKHYGSSNMQGLQKEFTAKDVVWLSVNSTARSHPEYLEPVALNAKYKDWGSSASAMLMDDSGKVGRTYGARTTPHMYVIDPAGKLVYAGGIDDKRSANPADVKDARNFVRAALVESMSGKPVSTPTAAPYGCSIKYAG